LVTTTRAQKMIEFCHEGSTARVGSELNSDLRQHKVDAGKDAVGW
jgi:hypothetical protein